MTIKEIQRFIEMVKRGDDSLQERYDLIAERKSIAQKQMDELQKQMDTINHKLWYYQTAIEAGTEAIHKKVNVKDNE